MVVVSKPKAKNQNKPDGVILIESRITRLVHSLLLEVTMAYMMRLDHFSRHRFQKCFRLADGIKK